MFRGDLKSLLMKTIKISLFIFLLGIVLFSCSKKDTVTEQPNPGGDTATDSTVKESTILALVNNVRKTGCTCGSTVMPAVTPLTWNNLLEKAAQLHSADMNKNNYFDHTTPDGSTPATALPV